MNTIKQKSSILYVLTFSICFLLFSSILTIHPRAIDDVMPINIEAQNEINNNRVMDGNDIVPNVSIDDAKDLVERKTYDIVELLQVFGKPFSAIMFIICAFITLFGTITKSAAVGKGIFGMFIAGFAYTGIMYAPEIMTFFSSWLST